MSLSTGSREPRRRGTRILKEKRNTGRRMSSSTRLTTNRRNGSISMETASRRSSAEPLFPSTARTRGSSAMPLLTGQPPPIHGLFIKSRHPETGNDLLTAWAPVTSMVTGGPIFLSRMAGGNSLLHCQARPNGNSIQQHLEGAAPRCMPMTSMETV